MNHKDGDQPSDSSSALNSSLTLDQLLKTGVARSELSLHRGVVTKEEYKTFIMRFGPLRLG